LHDVLRGRVRRADEGQEDRLTKLEVAMRDAPYATVELAILRSTVAARMGDVEATRRQLAIVGARGPMFYGYRAAIGFLAESYELANVLRVGGNDAAARALFSESADIARALGMTGLERSIGASVPVREDRVAAAPVRAEATRLDREGEIWRIEHAGAAARVKDS